jgi:hypothetical protein
MGFSMKLTRGWAVTFATIKALVVPIDAVAVVGIVGVKGLALIPRTRPRSKANP